MDHFISERLHALRMEALSPSFDLSAGDDRLKERLKVFRETFGKDILALEAFTDQGKLIASSLPSGSPENQSFSRGSAYRSFDSDRFVGDVFHSPEGRPLLAIAVKSGVEGDKVILTALIDARVLTSLVSGLFQGTTGRALIFSRIGEPQTTLPSGGGRPDAIDPKSLRLSDVPMDAVAVVENAGTRSAGLLVMAIRSTNTDWTLTFFQNAEEAFAAVNSGGFYALTAFFLGIVAIVVASVGLSTRMAKHVAGIDQEKQLINEQLIEAGKLASLGEMAAGIAHEINNPVGIMIQEAGWMQDLLDDDDAPEDRMDEFHRSLGKIQTQGKRCKDITLKLLSFARRSDPKLTVVRINQLAEDVTDLCTKRASLNKVEIETILQEDLPDVHASPSEVQQVLLNLINNGLDAMEGGGGTIRITTRTAGSHVAVDVSDTGPGIARENLMKIFEPFFTTKPVGKGTGLGLAICFGIMKRMGGDITVTSKEGHGTTFNLFFPLPK
jgi:two-component system, NtrC family, sensor kinase